MAVTNLIFTFAPCAYQGPELLQDSVKSLRVFPLIQQHLNQIIPIASCHLCRSVLSPTYKLSSGITISFILLKAKVMNPKLTVITQHKPGTWREVNSSGKQCKEYLAMELLFLLIPSIFTTVIINKNDSFQKSLFNQAKY